MSDLVPSPTDPTTTPTATVPDDGQRVDASSVRPAFQALLNFIAFLRVRLSGWISGGTVIPDGDVTVSGVNVTVSNGLTAGGLTVTGDSTLSGHLASLGGADLIGENHLTGKTLITNLSGAVGFNSLGTDRGRVPKRPLLGADLGTALAPHTIQPAVHDLVVFPVGTLTTTRYWQISDTGFPTIEGDHLTIYNGDVGSNSIQVLNPAGAGLGAVAPGSAESFVKIGTTWYFAG